MPVTKAAAGADVRSWLSHFQHPLENRGKFWLWLWRRASAKEVSLTQQAPCECLSGLGGRKLQGWGNSGVVRRRAAARWGLPPQ